MEQQIWRVLVADDDRVVHETINKIFANERRVEIISAMSGPEAIQLVRERPRGFALCLVDQKMPIMSGSQTVPELLAINKDLLVAVLSGYRTADNVQASWKAGAAEFIDKSLAPESLREKILEFCEKYETTIRVLEDDEEKSTAQALIEGYGLHGASAEFAFACGLAKKASASDFPVLICGESGTGKEIIAKLIHKLSRRKNMNCVAVNMSTISQELFESQLFGHTKGSFTGAIHDHQGHFKCADGGTLFLDEVGETPLLQQAKLLRAIQEQEIQPVGARKPEKINVRFIAATNLDIEKAIENKQFRSDLFIDSMSFQLSYRRYESARKIFARL